MELPSLTVLLRFVVARFWLGAFSVLALLIFLCTFELTFVVVDKAKLTYLLVLQKMFVPVNQKLVCAVMINVALIKEKAKSMHYTLKQLAEAIEMSEGGFHTALANNSLKVDAIEKLALILGMQLNEIIDMDQKVGTVIKNKVNNGVGTILGVTQNITTNSALEATIRFTELEKEIEILRAKLASSEAIIEVKDQQILDLRELVSLYKGKSNLPLTGA